ncbi:MAG: hypothetical protein V1744_07915 [Candidatus Altiarchaeota archaeon]
MRKQVGDTTPTDKNTDPLLTRILTIDVTNPFNKPRESKQDTLIALPEHIKKLADKSAETFVSHWAERKEKVLIVEDEIGAYRATPKKGWAKLFPTFAEDFKFGVMSGRQLNEFPTKVVASYLSQAYSDEPDIVRMYDASYYDGMANSLKLSGGDEFLNSIRDITKLIILEPPAQRRKLANSVLSCMLDRVRELQPMKPAGE